jgi:hypothetical protein
MDVRGKDGPAEGEEDDDDDVPDAFAASARLRIKYGDG